MYLRRLQTSPKVLCRVNKTFLTGRCHGVKDKDVLIRLVRLVSVVCQQYFVPTCFILNHEAQFSPTLGLLRGASFGQSRCFRQM